MHRPPFIFIFAAFAIVAVSIPARAQQPIECVSVNTDGTGNGGADQYVGNPTSADGRYIAFSSSSSQLVTGDLNGFDDVFVRDRLTGTNILISVASDGSQGNGNSIEPGISGDGRFVAFASQASDFVTPDTNGLNDLFLRDRDPDGNGIFDEGNETTICISRKWTGGESDGVSLRPCISSDGSTVAFECDSQLTPDSDDLREIYAYDVASGTLSCVSLGFDGSPGGDASGASISDDGNRVAFESYNPNLVRNDQNSKKDVFLRNRRLGTTQIVSVSTDGTQGDKDSFNAGISGDGATVAFASSSQNLIAPRTGGGINVYVRDVAQRTTTCITVLPDGTESGGDRPSLSEDGTLVVFESSASDFVPLDQNDASDVFLFDRSAGTYETISADCVGFTANARSLLAAMTPDGRFISFFSDATNLTDGDFLGDLIYLRDRSIPWPTASRSTYGAGWPGTLGVPDLTADVDPQYGATVHVDFGNSWGFWTVGFLLVGLSQDSLPTSKDGTLLVEILETMPLAVGPGGVEVQTTIPYDESLCGVEIDLQGIELDPGATKRVSFTPGLQLIVGR
jgi:Tol biopolymer transport system component